MAIKILMVTTFFILTTFHIWNYLNQAEPNIKFINYKKNETLHLGFYHVSRRPFSVDPLYAEIYAAEDDLIMESNGEKTVIVRSISKHLKNSSTTEPIVKTMASELLKPLELQNHGGDLASQTSTGLKYMFWGLNEDKKQTLQHCRKLLYKIAKNRNGSSKGRTAGDVCQLKQHVLEIFLLPDPDNTFQCFPTENLAASLCILLLTNFAEITYFMFVCSFFVFVMLNIILLICFD